MLGLSVGIGLGTQAVASGGGAATTSWNTAFNSNFTYSNSNKTAAITAGGTNQTTKAILGKTAAGSFTVTCAVVATNTIMGFGASTLIGTDWVGSGSSCGYFSSGSIFVNGVSVQTGLATYTVADVITAAWDGAGHIQFKKNGTNVGTAVDMTTILTGTVYPMATQKDATTSQTADFTSWG